MSERVISFDQEQALIKAADDVPIDESPPPEWFVVRYLAHALCSTGDQRRRCLARFADYLEEFLKSQPN